MCMETFLHRAKKPKFVNYCQTYETCAAACLALLNMPMLTNQNHSKRTGFAVCVQYLLSEYCWTQFPYLHKKTCSRSDEVEKVVTMLQERKLQKCKAGKREKKLTKQTETIVSMWKTAWSPDRNGKAVQSCTNCALDGAGCWRLTNWMCTRISTEP